MCVVPKFDPITDPLGICGVPPPPGNGAIPPGTPGGTLKRRASEDGAVPPAKKFVLAYVCSFIKFVVILRHSYFNK